MLVAIDAVGIRGHGGAAVLSELLHWLPRVCPDWRFHVFLLARPLREFADPVASPQVTIECTARGNTGIGRLRWVYHHLPRRLRQLRPDVLLSFSNLGSARPCLPQVVFCHQSHVLSREALHTLPWPIRAKMTVLQHWFLRGVQGSERVVVQTEPMQQNLLGMVPRLAGRVHVIPSGYRTAPAVPAIRPDKQARILGASRPRLVYVAHPGGHKNHEVLVRALPGIVQAFPAAKLLLTVEEVKNAPDRQYLRYVQVIRQSVDKEQMGGHVVFLGVLTPDEVAYVLAQSDLMLFPSLAESFGLPLVEALAAGCPVVAADRPYAHHVTGEAAEYFDPEDPDALAALAVGLIGDRARRERLLHHGSGRRLRFSYETIARQVAEVLRAACRH